MIPPRVASPWSTRRGRAMLLKPSRTEAPRRDRVSGSQDDRHPCASLQARAPPSIPVVPAPYRSRGWPRATAPSLAPLREFLSCGNGGNMSMKNCIGTRFRQAVILGLVALIVAGLAPVAGAATSSNVAYVFDFGTGANDPGGPGTGSRILVKALAGVAPGLTYTSSGPTPLPVTITNVSVSANA